MLNLMSRMVNQGRWSANTVDIVVEAWGPGPPGEPCNTREGRSQGRILATPIKTRVTATAKNSASKVEPLTCTIAPKCRA
jgi:hypothetical protein